jgi:RNA recognition motif-containing protein
LIKDKITGRAKGFGFVEMPDDAQAKAAIAGTNGKDLLGRALNVNEARPLENRPSRGGGGFDRGGGGSFDRGNRAGSYA